MNRAEARVHEIDQNQETRRRMFVPAILLEKSSHQSKLCWGWAPNRTFESTSSLSPPLVIFFFLLVFLWTPPPPLMGSIRRAAARHGRGFKRHRKSRIQWTILIAGRGDWWVLCHEGEYGWGSGENGKWHYFGSNSEHAMISREDCNEEEESTAERCGGGGGFFRSDVGWHFVCFWQDRKKARGNARRSPSLTSRHSPLLLLLLQPPLLLLYVFCWESKSLCWVRLSLWPVCVPSRSIRYEGSRHQD